MQGLSNRHRRALLAAAAICMGHGGPASAQEGARTGGALDLGTVVISANRTPTDAAKVGSAVTVIDRATLERARETYLKDYLDRVPGLNFAQIGGPGGLTTVMMRGANAAYIMVRIDGIEVSDPTKTQTAAALEHMLVGDVERIEILRGSQSALYGGTAVAGVIDITTRRADGPGVSHRAAVEVGSFGTVSGRYGLSAATETSEVNLSIERNKTDGISSADSRAGNREKDGYDNTTFSANAATRLNEAFRVFGALRYSRHDSAFDDFVWGVGPTDEIKGTPRNRTIGEDAGVRVGADLDLLDGRWKNTLSVQHYDTQSTTWGGYPGHYDGDRTKLEYLGSFRLNDMLAFSFGADYARETARSSEGLSGSIDNAGAFAQASLEPIAGLTLTGALRNDHHSTFGDHPTARATAAYRLFEGTKLRASWGTGFRPPSAYELFAPIYGNRTLKPEESRSLDAGIDQSFWDGRLTLSATVFKLDTRDLIQFAYDTGAGAYRYLQVPGLSQRRGIELAGKVQALDWLALDGSYTFTQAEQADGSPLLRVPRHKATVGATVTAIEKTTVSVRGTWVDDMRDTDYSVILPDFSSPVRKLPTYFLLDATVTYRLTDTFDLTLRGRNLLDQRYQTVWGYGTPGASVYAGLSARF